MKPKKPPIPLNSRKAIAFREAMLGQMLPPEVQAWAPVQRMLEIKPGQRADCGLRHVTMGLIRDRIAPGYWPRTLDMLERHGFLLPGDPPLPRLDPEHWSIFVADQRL